MTELSAVPAHVAVIMDGNGRWAKQRMQPRSFGHRAGRKSVDKIVAAAVQAGIDTLTLFAFSTENWNRPAAEVELIMDVIRRSIAEESQRLKAQNIRMRILGSRERLSEEMCRQFDAAESLTADCTGMQLIFALNYSGQWEILQTCRNLLVQAQAGGLSEELSLQDFEAARPIADLPPVDLLIRSSGEMRISNFLLWELAYAELYFTETLWPDFDEQEFQRALAAYAQRERRFGALCTT